MGRSGAVLLTVLVAGAPVVLSPALGVLPVEAAEVAAVHEGVPAHLPVTRKQVPPELNPFAVQQALARLDDRLEAVEAATATLVGHPLVPAAPAPPVHVAHLVRTGSMPRADVTERLQDDPADAAPPDVAAEPPQWTGEPEQLPPRIDDARQELDEGDLSSAIRAVDDVEQDVLLVATDLADGSAQTAALARQLVATDPHVAVLDAAVAATHAAADARDVVAAAAAAIQARDAATGVTLAADVAAQSADEALKAAIALAELQAHSTDGFTNGNIPLEVLCPVVFAPQHHLRCDAAEALGRMNVAYREAFGHDIVLTDSYRTLEAQVRTKAAKGPLAATPGTSNHGWGLAIDLGDGANSYRSAQYAWLKVNAVLYGWHHPSYMDEGGRGPHEPWHWEFGTVDDRGTGTSAPILVNGEPNAATPVVPVEPATTTPTDAPTPSPTPTPSGSPTPTPTAGESPTPTDSPSPEPSGSPTEQPTDSPTDAPTDAPTDPTDPPTDPATEPTTPAPDPTDPSSPTPTEPA
ncbi:M15 family metallopeptidase [Cellulomonas chitinilytica]|uniref:M15 family metallopeptidase n=1 Tax=Cellulomonas chitinilytica TaxID=398759 RepID=UPI0019412DED|nr:M15 family metallopeptidase [Cellulomonas chitinilytica]